MEFWALCSTDTWKKNPSLSMERLEQGQNEHVSKGCQGGGITGALALFARAEDVVGDLTGWHVNRGTLYIRKCTLGKKGKKNSSD